MRKIVLLLITVLCVSCLNAEKSEGITDISQYLKSIGMQLEIQPRLLERNDSVWIEIKLDTNYFLDEFSNMLLGELVYRNSNLQDVKNLELSIYMKNSVPNYYNFSYDSVQVQNLQKRLVVKKRFYENVEFLMKEMGSEEITKIYALISYIKTNFNKLHDFDRGLWFFVYNYTSSLEKGCIDEKAKEYIDLYEVCKDKDSRINHDPLGQILSKTKLLPCDS